jgi:hypothetical protein
VTIAGQCRARHDAADSAYELLRATASSRAARATVRDPSAVALVAGTPQRVGVVVPLRVVLARTDQAAVAVVGVTAYTRGVSLRLALRWRSRPGEEGFNEAMLGMPFGPGAMPQPLGGELST